MPHVTMAHRGLFEHLDKAEALLSKQRYLAGDRFTEADLRLFVTLIRFDEVYVVSSLGPLRMGDLAVRPDAIWGRHAGWSEGAVPMVWSPLPLAPQRSAAGVLQDEQEGHSRVPQPLQPHARCLPDPRRGLVCVRGRRGDRGAGGSPPLMWGCQR